MLKFIIALGVVLLLGGCKSNINKQKNEVVIRAFSDPDQLNPLNSRNEVAGYIHHHIFQNLLMTDRKSYEFQPVLVESRPEIEKLPNGGMKMSFTLRKEAEWSDGKSVTTEDVVFSFKALKNPYTDCMIRKPYLEFVSDILVKDDRRFDLICDEVYHLGEGATDVLYIIPKHIYDKNGWMESISLSDLRNIQADTLDANSRIRKFAEEFNSLTFQRDIVQGSGPYELVSWIPQQSLVLKKKENWWGDQLAEVNHFFEAYPEFIRYEIIPDANTAVTALKQGRVDVMGRVPLREFSKELRSDDDFMNDYRLLSPDKFSYEYLGMHQEHFILRDRSVRLAIAHLVDVESVIDKLSYGLAQRTIGPIHPAKTKFYNDTIQPYLLDVEKAKGILSDAGWKDSNGDGVLENKMNGKSVDLELSVLLAANSQARKNHALLLQQQFKQAGIRLKIVPKEMNVFLSDLKAGNFDLYLSGWITGPSETDLKQIFHSSAINGGGNFVRYRSAKMDRFIEDIRTTLSESKRIESYKKVQSLLHKDLPYVFLMSVEERLAIHKKWTNAYGTGIRPGYWANGFKLKAN